MDITAIAIWNLASMITVAKNFFHRLCRVKNSRVSAEPLPQQQRQLQQWWPHRLVFHIGIQSCWSVHTQRTFQWKSDITASKNDCNFVRQEVTPYHCSLSCYICTTIWCIPWVVSVSVLCLYIRASAKNISHCSYIYDVRLLISYPP